jgi:hypothetical protein
VSRDAEVSSVVRRERNYAATHKERLEKQKNFIMVGNMRGRVQPAVSRIGDGAVFRTMDLRFARILY